MDLSFTLNYTISPAGVIALATLAAVGVIMYGAYKIQQYKETHSQ